MKKLKALILAIILIIISLAVIVINGKTYIVKVNNIHNVNNVDELIVQIQDDNIVKCVDKNFENGTLNIKLESVSTGKTYMEVKNVNKDDKYFFDSIYVHNLGIITINEYMGISNCSIIIPIAITVWLIYVLYLLIVSYRKSVNENMYQYKNIAYLGVIIFTIFAIITQIFALFNYNGVINTINEMLRMFSFATILLPITFIVSILVIISNIVLIRKEGFNFTNILGIILGTVLCLTTVTPEVMYRLVYSASWIDVHNQNGIGLYIYNSVEAIIYILITYIECILIGTIIMGVKSARHIPTFDKDFIIILGCQIKKDGTLTPLLKSRVDRAIEFSKMQKENANKDIIFVPSGGKGNDESIAEAVAIKNYLLEQGIKDENILIDDKSKNTFENIKFSSNLIKEKMKDAKIAFSTTNYHVFRAGCIATEQNLKLEGIGAKTKRYFWINAFIREFVATLFSEKKKHIAVIGGIILIAIIMIIITYFNNNL